MTGRTARGATGERAGDRVARTRLRSLTSLLLAGAAAAMLAAAIAARAASPAEQAANCAEAAERYRSEYGRAPDAETTPVVMMFKHTFCPPHLTVRQGTEVRFVNVDRRTSHSFWFKDAGRPESDRFFSGEGASMVMDLAPGEHTYLCGPHWEQEGMVGRITILPR